eukprot:TRINITY_DN19901_c0_g1_i1.p1 TRINITY_DN19901_c0_g1~~TRINITY_DN19901_c0_g1_i1.p1  ORF type:complete len:346 (+),score=36.52 TRINITY_DN19901_c0_g1_i1:115-1152(+)
MRCAVYNPLAATESGRIEDILQQCSSVHLLCMPGNKFRKHQLDGDPFVLRSRKKFWCFDWGYDATKQHSNRSCGVSLCIAKRAFSDKAFHTVFSPPEALAGRGGAVRIRTAKHDILVMGLYVPPETESDKAEAADKLYEWASQVVSQMPSRCLPLILLDANGRVGWRKQDHQWVPEEEHMVGEYNRERRNRNGERLLWFMQLHYLCAANTYFRAGETYWGERNGEAYASRIDYCVLPQTKLRRVSNCRIWQRASDKLQLITSAARRDHRILVTDVELHLEYTGEDPQHRWDYTSIMDCLQHGKRRPEFLAAVDQELEARLDNWNKAIQCSRPDNVWKHLSMSCRL